MQCLLRQLGTRAKLVPGVCYYGVMNLLITCLIIILIKLLWILWAFSLQIFWNRKVPLVLPCQFVNHVRHSESSFSVLDTLHWCSDTSRQKHQLLVHSKFLCLTVSNPRKTWHGHSLMGSHWHIRHLTQNWLLRSAWSRHCSGPPKHHHCLPETLLPKMLVSKSSVGLIWIYTFSQLQTKMWDAFQGCDSISQNYVAFTWISSCSNVNKWGCIAS